MIQIGYLFMYTFALYPTRFTGYTGTIFYNKLTRFITVLHITKESLTFGTILLATASSLPAVLTPTYTCLMAIWISWLPTMHLELIEKCLY